MCTKCKPLKKNKTIIISFKTIQKAAYPDKAYGLVSTQEEEIVFWVRFQDLCDLPIWDIKLKLIDTVWWLPEGSGVEGSEG